jgi:hypothetical protein
VVLISNQLIQQAYGVKERDRRRTAAAVVKFRESKKNKIKEKK